MKRTFLILALSALLLSVTALSGCFLLNPIPKEYIEGVKVDRDYPDDALEIYDDAVVFEYDERRGKMEVTCGTEDDLDDIVDFYREFFDDNDVTLSKEDEGKDEYYAKGRSLGYDFEIEVEEADGEHLEDLFEYIIYITIEELDDDEKPAEPQTQTTPKPDEQPAQTTLDLSLDFSPLNYPAAAHDMKVFGSEEDFIYELFYGTWKYSTTQLNSNAFAFNGGYTEVIDILNSDLQYVYLVYYMDDIMMYDIDTVTGEIINETVFEQVSFIPVNGTYAACVSSGEKTMYNGAEHQVKNIFFINTMGQLVYSTIIYDEMSMSGVHISAVNVYVVKDRWIGLHDSGYGLMEFQEANSQQTFEATVRSQKWMYMGTYATRIDMYLEGFTDIAPDYIMAYEFAADGTLIIDLYDLETEEFIQQVYMTYEVGDLNFYYIGQDVEFDGLIYESTVYYYLSTEGYLIEVLMLYDVDMGEYFLVSNANVFVPVS